MATKTTSKTTGAKKAPAKKSDGLKSVTLKLSAPGAGSVSVAGAFNDWHQEAHPMAKDKAGVWKIALRLKPGVYEYKFIVDGQWQTDPGNPDVSPNEHGTLNSVLKV